MARNGTKKAAMHFKTVIQADVPQGRNGKHKSIVTRIIDDLDQLKDGSCHSSNSRRPRKKSVQL
jgi:hypothetical protein